MEWIKRTHDICGNEIDNTFYYMEDLKFTNDEANEIRRILNRYSPGEVERCISGLEFVCQDYSMLLNQQKPGESIEVIEEIVSNLKKALRDVKHLQKNGSPVANMKSVPAISSVKGERKKHFVDEDFGKTAFFDCYFLARDAKIALEPLIECLEAIQPQRPKRGKPSSEGGFTKAVASVFEECFKEKPSTYKDGPFAQVLAVCLEGLGLPHEDPGRRLKTLRQK